MQLGITFNSKALIKDLLGLNDNLRKTQDKALKSAALLVQSEAKKNIQRGGRSGHVYRRRTVLHRASAPGEYPKSDTGRLASSISVKFGNKIAVVGSNLNYAAYLENKEPKDGGRPWLMRTYQENRVKIEKLYIDAIRDALR